MSDGEPNSVGLTDARWCETAGACGIEVSGGLRMDTCGNKKWLAEDAGPGFLFFKHLDMESSGRGFFLFQTDYKHFKDMSIQGMKDFCLGTPACVGFDSSGWMKMSSFRPTRRTTPSNSSTGSIEEEGPAGGLWMKRRDVLTCTLKWEDTCDTFATQQVCGTNGVTYKSTCKLQFAKCIVKDLEEAYEGPCRDSYLTPMGCQCKEDCSTSLLANYKWCETEGGCGQQGQWDFCNDHPSGASLAGDGFEYYGGMYPSHGTRGVMVAEDGTSQAELAVACGMDADCGGYTSEGLYFDRQVASDSSEWRERAPVYQPGALVPKRPGGMFRKTPELLACQQPCEAVFVPVCLLANMETYDSACFAKQALCYLRVKGVGAKSDAMVSGVCHRPGQFNLGHMVTRWRARAATATPPGVPVTCVYGTKLATEVALKYEEFSGHVREREYVDGDSMVPAETVVAVCSKWARKQLDPVRLIPQLPAAKLPDANYFSYHDGPTANSMGHASLLSHPRIAKRIAEAAMENWPYPAQAIALQQFAEVNMDDIKECQWRLEKLKLGSLSRRGDPWDVTLRDQELAPCVSAMLRLGILADLAPGTTEVGVQDCSSRAMSDWRMSSLVCCMVKDTFGPGTTQHFPCRLKMPTQHSARKMTAVSKSKGFRAVRDTKPGLHERLLESLAAGPLRPTKFSAGKSGSSFMLTVDNRFLLKNVRTDSQDEQRALHKLLDGYKGRQPLTEYLRARGGKTLLNVILGMYHLEFAGYKATFILMEDASMGMGRNRDPACITRTYDLKGKSRADLPEELADETKKERENVEFKKFEQGNFHLSPVDCKRLREGIAHDGMFLTEHNQIDYSVYARFGSPQCMMPECEEGMQQRANCFTTTTGEKLAVAVIDYLNKYNFMKTMESVLPGSWGKFAEYARKTSEFVNESCPI